MDEAPVSVQAMGWVFDHSPTSGMDRLVMLSVANHAGESLEGDAWESWPGVKLIAREAGTDRVRSVQDAITRLCQQGHLERIVNGAPDSRIPADRRPNLYRITLTNGTRCDSPKCGWCAAPAPTPEATGVSDGVTPLPLDGVTDDAARGDGSRRDGVSDGDTQTVIEPSLEPSSSHPPSGTPAPAGEEDRDAEQEARARARAACDLVGLHHHRNTKGEVRMPQAHLAKCQEAARARHWLAVVEAATAHPDRTPEVLAENVLRNSSGLNGMATDSGRQAALRAIGERNAERAEAERDAPPPDPAAVAAARAEAHAALDRTRPTDP